MAQQPQQQQQQCQPFPPEEMANIDPTVLATAQPLTNMEMQLLLKKWADQSKEADPLFTEPPNVREVKSYLDKVADPKQMTVEILDKIRQRCASFGLVEWEIVLIANLLPPTAQAAMHYLPSLEARYNEEELNVLLEDLERYSQRF